MPRKYNGFAELSAGLKLLLPAALVVLAGCAGEPPKAPEPAPAQAPAATEQAPVTPPPVADIAPAVAAADVPLRKDAPLSYVVKKGDTLWGIAGYYLEDPWQWPQLWYDNGQIKNPHLIYPGDRLRLVWVNGRAHLALDEAGGGMTPDRVTHLSPEMREEPLDQALPAIPVDAIRQFLISPRLVTSEELKSAPYIVGFPDEHITAGANDGIFVKGLPSDNTHWTVIEPGDPYHDPDNGDLLGYEAIPIGNTDLVSYGQQVATMRLTTSAREARSGDRLLPLEAVDFNANFIPHAPTKPVNGRIISVFGGVSEVSQYEIVALNRGSRDGLDTGAVLSIHITGDVVADPYDKAKMIQLPDVYAGTMMVFKTTPRLSYALVMIEKRPVHVLDRFAKPQLGEH